MDALPPGSTLGILGGGQLGRMLSQAASRLGFDVVILDPEDNSPAGRVSRGQIVAPYDDPNALDVMGKVCGAVTFEFENVPAASVDRLRAGGARVAPGPVALAASQDRVEEKTFLNGVGATTVDFHVVDGVEDIIAGLERLGAPALLKTRREGYDGKGQWRIASERDLEALPAIAQPAIYEGLVRFEAEFSVILVRGRDGEVRFWDSPRNEHRDGILGRSLVPAGERIESQVEAARELAGKVADKLGYVGVLTLEFFATSDGPVVNEMAPRVHNSGHWTIEGAATSQFENHIRAVAGLPLGDTRTVARAVEMTNLIGGDVAQVLGLLGEPDTHLHLYGKKQARAGRKMGHVTRLTR